MVLGPLGDKFGARQTLGASLILSALSMVHICVVKALCVCVCVLHALNLGNIYTCTFKEYVSH